jgi:hypothetical protein
VAPAAIADRIRMFRGQRVLLDSDLAQLYGVTPKRLNEQIRRNRGRFLADFVIQLEFKELRERWSQIATTSKKYRGSKRLSWAFTELARKLEALEKSDGRLDFRTQKQFDEVYSANQALMTPPAPKSRPIGFTADVESRS